jgi:TolB protein
MNFRPIFYCICAIAFTINGKSFATSPDVIDLGKIQARIPIPTYKITVECPDDFIRSYLEKLFRLHGSFTPVPNNAQFRFCFQKAANDTILFQVFPANQKTPCFSGQAQGKNVENTLCKIADKIVETTLKQPGFFDGKLAFSSNSTGKNEIYTSDILFATIERLTTNSDSITPRWNPKADSIIYTTYVKHGFPDIYVLDTHTLSKNKIASYRGVNSCGNFDPLGQRIAMVLSSKKGSQVYTSDTNGRGLKPITTDISIKASPIWSPDGKSIIYTSDQLGKPQLFIIDLATGKSSRIAANISGYVAEAHWNPVYKNLISFTAAFGQGFQIGIYDLESKQFEILTSGPADHMESCWLPDGRHLILIERTRSRTYPCIFDSMTRKKTAFNVSLKNIHTPSYRKTQ